MSIKLRNHYQKIITILNSVLYFLAVKILFSLMSSAPTSTRDVRFLKMLNPKEGETSEEMNIF